MAEEWRVIPGFESYEVSDQGRVRGLKSGIVLRPAHNPNGYAFVSLRKNGAGRYRSVHRLVLLAFIGPSELDCNHKNGIRDDNRLDNLEYMTTRDNLLHAFRVLKSRDQRGEHNARSKLTEQQVREIRDLHARRVMGRNALAKHYGVSKHAIDHIVERKSWRHVK